MSLFIYSNTPSVIFMSNHYQHKHAKRLTMLWVDAWYERFTQILQIHDVMKQQISFRLGYFSYDYFDRFDSNHERVKMVFILDCKCRHVNLKIQSCNIYSTWLFQLVWLCDEKSTNIINRWFITCRYQISNEFTTAIYRCKNVV